MKLKDLKNKPSCGWKFTDPDTKELYIEESYEKLVSAAVKGRIKHYLSVPLELEQMIQDQICDMAGDGECEKYGLGDAVHAIAQPIAIAIDRVAGTNIQGCGACAKRRAKLNF